MLQTLVHHERLEHPTLYMLSVQDPVVLQRVQEAAVEKRGADEPKAIARKGPHKLLENNRGWKTWWRIFDPSQLPSRLWRRDESLLTIDQHKTVRLQDASHDDLQRRWSETQRFACPGARRKIVGVKQGSVENKPVYKSSPKILSEFHCQRDRRELFKRGSWKNSRKMLWKVF